VHVARLVDTAAGLGEHRAKIDRLDAERHGSLAEHPLRPFEVEPFAVGQIDIAGINIEIGGTTHLDVGRDQQQQEAGAVRFGDAPHPLQPVAQHRPVRGDISAPPGAEGTQLREVGVGRRGLAENPLKDELHGAVGS
jgi:hypothetical protein